MLKINHEKLSACGLTRADDAEVLRELCGLVERMDCHNRQSYQIFLWHE